VVSYSKFIIYTILVLLNAYSPLAAGKIFNLQKTVTFGSRELSYSLETLDHNSCTYILDQIYTAEKESEISVRLSIKTSVMGIKTTAQNYTDHSKLEDFIGVRDKIRLVMSKGEEGLLSFGSTKLKMEDFVLPAFQLPVRVINKTMGGWEMEATSEGVTILNQMIVKDLNHFSKTFPFEHLRNWRENWDQILNEDQPEISQTLMGKFVFNVLRKFFFNLMKQNQLQRLKESGEITHPPIFWMNTFSFTTVRFIFYKNKLTLFLGPQSYSYTLVYNLGAPRE
jgi:hypothetical protein